MIQIISEAPPTLKRGNCVSDVPPKPTAARPLADPHWLAGKRAIIHHMQILIVGSRPTSAGREEYGVPGQLFC